MDALAGPRIVKLDWLYWTVTPPLNSCVPAVYEPPSISSWFELIWIEWPATCRHDEGVAQTPTEGVAQTAVDIDSMVVGTQALYMAMTEAKTYNKL